jgi:hypothetical protein
MPGFLFFANRGMTVPCASRLRKGSGGRPSLGQGILPCLKTLGVLPRLPRPLAAGPLLRASGWKVSSAES